MIRVTAVLALTAAALGALTGCGSSSKSKSSSSSASSAPASGQKPKGKVRFVAPKSGAKTGSTLNVKVALKNFKIAPKAVGQAPRPGEGHLHFVMDGGKLDTPRYSGKNGLLGKKLGVTGKYSPALAPTITYRHLPRGKHKLEVYLANNNHTNVGVEASLKFAVK
jgi:hypothetical protein